MQAKAELPKLAVYDVRALANWNDQMVYAPSLIVGVEE